MAFLGGHWEDWLHSMVSIAYGQGRVGLYRGERTFS
jgi:hypothetical protein